jgi:hypothetical protein
MPTRKADEDIGENPKRAKTTLESLNSRITGLRQELHEQGVPYLPEAKKHTDTASARVELSALIARKTTMEARKGRPTHFLNLPTKLIYIVSIAYAMGEWNGDAHAFPSSLISEIFACGPLEFPETEEALICAFITLVAASIGISADLPSLGNLVHTYVTAVPDAAREAAIVVILDTMGTATAEAAVPPIPIELTVLLKLLLKSSPLAFLPFVAVASTTRLHDLYLVAQISRIVHKAEEPTASPTRQEDQGASAELAKVAPTPTPSPFLATIQQNLSQPNGDPSPAAPSGSHPRDSTLLQQLLREIHAAANNNPVNGSTNSYQADARSNNYSGSTNKGAHLNRAPAWDTLYSPHLDGTTLPTETELTSTNGFLKITSEKKTWVPTTSSQFAAGLLARYQSVVSGTWRTTHTAKMDPNFVQGIETAYAAHGLQYAQELACMATSLSLAGLKALITFDKTRCDYISAGIIPADASAYIINHPSEPHLSSLNYHLACVPAAGTQPRIPPGIDPMVSPNYKGRSPVKNYIYQGSTSRTPAATPNRAAPSRHSTTTTTSAGQTPICNSYNSASGCTNGNACPRLHVCSDCHLFKGKNVNHSALGRRPDGSRECPR